MKKIGLIIMTCLLVGCSSEPGTKRSAKKGSIGEMVIEGTKENSLKSTDKMNEIIEGIKIP